MDDFWDGFNFPTLDGETPVQQTSEVLEPTPDIATIETVLKKRAMVVFFVIDTSGTMREARIGAVNDAIRNIIPELKKREASNTSAEIRIAILEFDSKARWKTITPQPVSKFIYEDITHVYGGTNYGKAFEELNKKLSRSAFLHADAGSYTPLIIFLTDGKPSDMGLYPEELQKLKRNSWFQYATKVGIAIEVRDPEELRVCKRVLTEFTGQESMVLEATNINVLTKQIQLVTVTGVDFVTQQGSLQNTNNNSKPSNGNFGSNVNPVPANNQPSPAPAPAPSPAQPKPEPIDVHAGVNPIIPNMDTIDWENDFIM